MYIYFGWYWFLLQQSLLRKQKPQLKWPGFLQIKINFCICYVFFFLHNKYGLQEIAYKQTFYTSKIQGEKDLALYTRTANKCNFTHLYNLIITSWKEKERYKWPIWNYLIMKLFLHLYLFFSVRSCDRLLSMKLHTSEGIATFDV